MLKSQGQFSLWGMADGGGERRLLSLDLAQVDPFDASDKNSVGGD